MQTIEREVKEMPSGVLVDTLMVAKFGKTAVTPQRTGWGGCSHAKPTIGEMAASSAEAVEAVKARNAAGTHNDPPEFIARMERKAAQYALLVERFGAGMKEHKLTAQQRADAEVAAFLARLEAQENPFPPFTPDPNRARRIVCADGVSRPFATVEGGRS